MLPKIAWVLLPLSLYAVAVATMAWRGRMPSRMDLNVHASLLLLAYLLGTAGLGIFWVANQQLPVFDWHYLFGYATLLLAALHLVFNLPVVVRWLARKRGGQAPASTPPLRALSLGKLLAAALALGLAFYIGLRQGASGPPAGWVQAAPGTAPPLQAVIGYHAFSSESRSSVFARAPGVEWGGAPEPFKSYPAASHLMLERGAPGSVSLGGALRRAAPRRGPLTRAGLGQLLHLTAGVTERRGGHALRAAPSSGALFPSELYLLVRRVDGVDPGLYHYDPAQHRLELLGPEPAANGAPQAVQADVLVMLSAVFRRTGYKYHNRAFRYVAADAGHLLENLRIASHNAGMQAQLLAQFDELQAARALGIDGVEEAVLAMMALGGPAAAVPAANDVPVPDFLPPAQLPAGAIGVTGMVQGATSLRQAPSAAGAGQAALALPPPRAAQRDVHDTIVHRRSQRRFSGAALPLQALSDILGDMARPPQLSGAIEASLIVNRVEGLAPGVYRYRAQGHQLVAVRAGGFGAAAQSAALSQDVIGDAAVVLVLSADRERLLAPGARGYRHGLIEAGLVGERWVLGAVARGLAACPVGAFYDDEAAALIGVDGRRHWVLHFAALGVGAS